MGCQTAVAGQPEFREHNHVQLAALLLDPQAGASSRIKRPYHPARGTGPYLVVLDTDNHLADQLHGRLQRLRHGFKRHRRGFHHGDAHGHG